VRVEGGRDRVWKYKMDDKLGPPMSCNRERTRTRRRRRMDVTFAERFNRLLMSRREIPRWKSENFVRVSHHSLTTSRALVDNSFGNANYVRRC